MKLAKRRSPRPSCALSLIVEPSAPMLAPPAPGPDCGQAAGAVRTDSTPVRTDSTEDGNVTRTPSRRLPQRQRPSMAAGHASTICRAAAPSSSYQPQVASWDKQTHLVAYSAVVLSHQGRPTSRRSARSSSRRTRRSRSTERLVSFQKMKIAEANFPTLPKEQVREVVAAIDKAIPDDERVIALDRVLANLDKSQIVPKNVEGIKADPPTIFFSKTPAVIVNLDGEPIWSPIKDNDLKFAVNTNWDLFQHGPTNTLLSAQQRHAG